MTFNDEEDFDEIDDIKKTEPKASKETGEEVYVFSTDLDDIIEAEETVVIVDGDETLEDTEGGNAFIKKTAFFAGKTAITGLATAIGFVLLILVIVLCLPTKRFERNIKSADKFYYSADFEKAKAKYLKGEAVLPDSVIGYLGEILSMQAMADDAIQDRYEETAAAVLSIASIRESEADKATEFFLLAPEILSGREEARKDILYAAYEKLTAPAELKTALADAYFDYAKTLSDTSKKEALENFDIALELSGNSETFKETVSECVLSYVESLKLLDEFDQAYSVLEHYKELLSDKYDGAYEAVAASHALYNTKLELLSKVTEAMKPYYEQHASDFSKETVEAYPDPVFRMLDWDWSNMLSLDGSLAADTVAYSFSQNSYLYAESGFGENYTGVGCGLYTYGNAYDNNGRLETGYYFYYGDYKNGKRDGYGFSIVRVDATSYLAFEGEWKDDMPNGFGVLYKSDMYAYTSLAEYRQITYGNWTDGYANGSMTSKAVLNEHPDTFFLGGFDAANGNVEALEGDPIEYGIVDAVTGRKLIAILQSVTDGYNHFFTIYLDEGQLVKIFGFGQY